MKLINLQWLFIFFVVSAYGESRPNILFLFSDDHALRTIGAYPGSINSTPNLDRIAREGALFTNSFNVNSICCPSRAAILTGKHSQANGVIGNSSKWNGKQWVFSREIGKSGYQTGLIGKWHLKGNPTDEFQSWEILSGKGGQGSYFNPTFLSPRGESKVTGHSTKIITDKALRWLKNRDQKKPFLLCAQYKVPHIHRLPPINRMKGYDDIKFPVPDTFFDDFSTRSSFVSDTWMALKGMKGHVLNIAPTEEEIDKNPKICPPFLSEMNLKQRKAWHSAYDPRNLKYRKLIEENKLEGKAKSLYIYQRFIRDYIRCIDGLDYQIGRILDYLDQNNLSKNTLVIYSSDQGFFTGEHGWAEKRWMYEESFKSPLIMRWPGKISPGSKIIKLVQNIDLAPTFLKASGLPVPNSIHGLALQPLFSKEYNFPWRKDILYQYFDGGTPEKRGPYNMPRHEGIRDERYKLISFYEFNQWEFYDLENDPNELNNLFRKKQFKPEIKRLQQRLLILKDNFFKND